MKIKSLLPTMLILAAFLNSCVKDTCMETSSYTWFEPVYATSAEIRANIKSGPAHAIKTPGKLFIIGNYIFLNELNEGIHIINNSNPAAPVNEHFIAIPGNLDIAVKGNILYADLYTDLLALNISNPNQIRIEKIIEGVFPERMYGNFMNPAPAGQMISMWKRHDTTITQSCSFTPDPRVFFMDFAGGVVAPTNSLASGSSSGFSSSGPTGVAGSMARFALVNNYLYTVGTQKLNSFSIQNPGDPQTAGEVQLNWGIETIYPMQDKLFIGSTNGMYIFSISNPANPQQLGTFSHARVCDPVIADGNYAFVTLRNGTTCAGFINELNIIDITNLLAPTLTKRYELFNPHGLTKDNQWLFICDGAEGIKIYDATDVLQLNLKKQISGLDTYDAIAWNGRLIVVAKDGLYQFNYSDINNIQQISKISVTQ